MAKDVTLHLRVLQTNPATAAEVTKTDKEGNVTGIDRQIYEDVRLTIAGIDTGAKDGGGRLTGGEIVLSVPEGTFSVGDKIEGSLKVVSPDDDAPASPPDPLTLRQDPEEARRGRDAQRNLGPEPGKSSKRSSSRKKSTVNRSSGSSAPEGASSGSVPGPQETDQRAGSSNRPAA